MRAPSCSCNISRDTLRGMVSESTRPTRKDSHCRRGGLGRRGGVSTRTWCGQQAAGRGKHHTNQLTMRFLVSLQHQPPTLGSSSSNESEMQHMVAYSRWHVAHLPSDNEFATSVHR